MQPALSEPLAGTRSLLKLNLSLKSGCMLHLLGVCDGLCSVVLFVDRVELTDDASCMMRLMLIVGVLALQGVTTPITGHPVNMLVCKCCLSRWCCSSTGAHIALRR